jgi:hypothetical protein
MKKLKLLNDQAIGEQTPHDKQGQRKDGLDFSPYAGAISQAIFDTNGPFTMVFLASGEQGKPAS